MVHQCICNSRQLSAYEHISPHKTAVVIVSYNEKHLTQECIRSIRETLPADAYSIVVVDNASTDGVREWLEEQEDLLVVENDQNVGFGPACNIGVETLAAYEEELHDIFLLNNDTRLMPNALLLMKAALYASDDMGAVGAVSNYAGNHQQLDILFDRAEDYAAFAQEHNRPCAVGAEAGLPAEAEWKTWADTEERVRLCGFAMLIRRELWDAIGGFDEDFAPGYFEDDALSMEILRRGFRLSLVRNAFIYHAGSQSFSKRDDVNNLLQQHQDLFIRKYGFDSFAFAYADVSLMLTEVSENDVILELGSGLGANLRMLRSRCPGCVVVGVEEDSSLRQISDRTLPVFANEADLVQEAGRGIFTKLIISGQAKVTDAIRSLCRADVELLVKREEYNEFPFDKLKLVIWDLDDTLWNGTLSEGAVHMPMEHAQLVMDLTDHGIINSVSSKNDETPALDELTACGLRNFFVFNRINWEEKGTQIHDKLKEMGLRAENTLFIDDNPRNLEEAKYANPGLMVADPGILPYLRAFCKIRPALDTAHKRLAQYQLLEEKTQSEATYVSREAFLYDSGIHVAIHRNCLEQIDRIAEMVARTNQLNYTKNRDPKDLLIKLITNDWNDSGYVSVQDKFGDYGIVGFFCYNTMEKRMEHFLFSCRVLGMGIEQYVYGKLGYPAFEVKQPVAARLVPNGETPWICEDYDREIRTDQEVKKRIRILLKGPCDMSAIEPYLAGGSTTTEFNYVNDKGYITTGQNHSMHIYQSATLSPMEQQAILRQAPFLSEGDFKTKLFENSYHVICYSTLQDMAAGLYKDRETGAYVSFGSRNYPLTDQSLWDSFIKGTIPNHQFPFTEDILRAFAERWEFVGNTPVDLLLRNLDFLCEHVPGNPLIILLLGSEIACEKKNPEFDGLEEVYREVNPILREYAEGRDHLKLINFTEFVHSQEDYFDSINHFSRNVYYEVAGRIAELINASHFQRIDAS